MLTLFYQIVRDGLTFAGDAKQAKKQHAVVVECLRMECQINLDLLGLVKKGATADPDYLDVVRELRCEVLSAILATADNTQILKKHKDDRLQPIDDKSILEQNKKAKTDYQVASFIFRKMAALQAYASCDRKGKAFKKVQVKTRLLNLQHEIVELDKRMRKSFG